MTDARKAFREAYPERVVRQEGGGDPAYEQLLLLELETEQGGPSMTRQSDLAASDINNIVKRYMREGVLPYSPRQGGYLDVSEVGDYRSAVEQVRAVEKFFGNLPAELRAKFKNDPAEFLDAVNDPDQLELLMAEGVLAPEAEEPVETPPAEPAAG